VNFVEPELIQSFRKQAKKPPIHARCHHLPFSDCSAQQGQTLVVKALRCVGLQVLCGVEVATDPAFPRNARLFFACAKLSLAESRALNAPGG